MNDNTRTNRRLVTTFATSTRTDGQGDDDRFTATGRIEHDARGNAVWKLDGADDDTADATVLMRILDAPELSLETTGRFRAPGINPYDHSASDTVRVQAAIDRHVREGRTGDTNITLRSPSLIERLSKLR